MATYPDIGPGDMRVAGAGWHSLAIEAGGRLIFKFPNGTEAVAASRREWSVLRIVGEHVQLPVPRMSLHEGPPLFTVHPRLDGCSLESRDYAALDDLVRDRLAATLARFLAELHAIDADLMSKQGARPIEWWDTSDEALSPVWAHLPVAAAEEARRAIAAYRRLRPDPLGPVFGHFDAHGWNMAFDRTAGKLNGIFDFGDCGIGPVHREFVQISLVDPDLAARTMIRYEMETGRRLSRKRVFLLTLAARLWEFAGALTAGGDGSTERSLLTAWLDQDLIR